MSKRSEVRVMNQSEIKRYGWSNLLMLLALVFAAVLTSAAKPLRAEAPVVSDKIENLKKELIALNRDLFILEEDLLFPTSTQVAVFLSMDVGKYFQLDAVELKLDDESVSHYLYTARQVNALHRGGMQRLFVGNVGQGEHQLTAFFTGIGPENRPYKRGVNLKFEKTSDAKALELQIVDSTASQQPEFKAVEL